MEITRKFKIYGRDGHRQRESFSPSYEWDFSSKLHVRKIQVLNSDLTGTNDYSVIIITRESDQEVLSELFAQLEDGIFENSRYGEVEEIA